MRRFLKWLAIGIASLAGLLILAVGGLLIALHTDWGREKVRTIAQDQIRPFLDGDIELGPVRGSVLSEFAIEGVRVKDARGNVVVTAKRAFVNYKLWALSDRTFKAYTLELVEPMIYGRRDENGVLNLSKLVKPQPKNDNAPWIIDIDALHIVNGLAVIPTATQTFSLARIGLDARVKITATAKQIEIAQANATWLERGLPVVMHGNIVHSEPLLAIAGLEVMAGASRLSIPLAMARPTAQAGLGLLDVDLKEKDLFLFWPHDFALGDVTLGGTIIRGGREQPVEGRLLAKVLGGEVHLAAAANPAGPGVTGEIRARGLVSPLPTFQAKLDADLSFDAAGKSLETLKGTVDLGARGMVMGRRIESLQLAGVAGGGVARLDITAEVPSAQATAHADLRLGRPFVLESARVKAQIMDLGAAAGIRDLDGQLDLEATVKGTFDALAVNGTADLRRVRSGQNRVAGARATFAMTGLPGDPRGEARVVARDVAAGKNALGNVTAQVNAPGGRVLDVRVVQGGAGVPYAVRAGARVGLEERATRITLRDVAATARGLTFTGRGGEVLLRKNGSFAARDISLRSPAGNVIVEGDVAPARRSAVRVVSLPTGKLHLHLQKLDLERLQAAFAPEMAATRPVAGTLSADLHIVRDGKSLGFEGEIAAAGISAGPNLPIVDSTARLNVFKGKLVTAGHVRTRRADGKGAGVADFAIESEVPADVFDGAAWRRVELDEALKGARVTVRDLDLGAVAALAGKRGYEGRLDATLEGRPATRAVAFTVTVNDLAVPPRVKAVDLAIDGVWDHEALDTTTKMLLKGAEVATVQARVGAGLRSVITGADVENLPLQGKVTVDRVQLAAFSDLLPLRRRTEGVLTASGTLRGTVSKPTGEARVLIDRPKLGRVAFREITAHAELDANRIEGMVVASQQAGGRLEASGRLDRKNDNNVTARITARAFDLGFLAGLSRMTTDALYGAGGVLDADVTAQASRGSRSANGRVQLTRGSFYLPTSGLVKEIELVATIDRGRATIEKLAGKAADGTVTVGGEVILAGLTPERFSAELKTSRFPVDAGTMVVSVDTRGAITGQRGDEQWSMDATFRGTHVHTPTERRSGEKLQSTGELEDVVFTDVPNFQKRTGLMALTGSPEVQQGGKRDVTLVLHTPGGVRVSGQDMDLTVQSNLTVYYRGGQSYVGGGVETSSGFIELYGRRYDIDRARASFDENELVNPRLDVRLSHDFRTTTLYIAIGGTLREPTLALSADPGSYDQQQLIGWVLGGDPDDPGVGKRPLDDQAFGLASNLVLGQVQTLLKSALPFDVLSVKVGEGSDTQTTRFEVGKWITEALFLGYIYRMNAPDDKNLNEANIEYRLSRRWLLEAFFGDRGVAGADLIWSKKY